MPKTSIPTTLICQHCAAEFPRKPGQPKQKYCTRRCVGKVGAQARMDWERGMVVAMKADGWQIISPTACCDRIGIKDGQLFFLEFKPKGRAGLREFQKIVKNVVPHMFRVVVGTMPARAEVRVLRTSYEFWHDDGYRRGGKRTSKNRVATSLFKGVYFDKAKGTWRSRVAIRGHRMDLGAFHAEEDAARAYDRAVREQYGPNAYLNFPDKK